MTVSTAVAAPQRPQAQASRKGGRRAIYWLVFLAVSTNLLGLTYPATVFLPVLRFARQPILACLLLWCLLESGGRFVVGPGSRKMALFGALFVLSAFVSAVCGVSPVSSLGYVAWHAQALFLVLLAIPHLIRSDDDAAAAISALEHSVWLFCGLSLLLIALGVPWTYRARTGAYTGLGFLQAQGIFARPNYLAPVAMLGALGAFRRLSSVSGRLPSLGCLLLLLNCGWLVAASKARAPLVGLGVGYLLMVPLRRLPLHGALLLVAMAAGSLASLPSLSLDSILYSLRITRPDASGDLSSGRLNLWAASLEAFPNAWLLGTGPGQEGMAVGEDLGRDTSTLLDIEFYRQGLGLAHNSYISVLLETGVLGAATFTLLLGFGIRRLWKLDWGPGPGGFSSKAALAATTALLIDALFVTALTTPGSPTYLLMWMTLSIGIRLGELNPKPRPNS